MKVFQIIHKYDPYIASFEKKYNITDKTSFKEIQSHLIKDGFYAPHLLEPVINQSNNSFYVIWDYERLQKTWAKENTINSFDLVDIITAQINKFKPDVIYNMSPQKLDYKTFETFNTKKICWNADAGSVKRKDFSKYDALLTSSPNIVEDSKNAYLFLPSQDKYMQDKSFKKEIDLMFYGQYAPNVFKERKEYIDKLIPFLNKNNISFKFFIMYKTWTTPMINRKFLWNIPFLQKKHPASNISKHFSKPIFGKEIYDNIKKSKIVFNIAGGLEEFKNYKSNMRIFESLGTGTFMLSDEGIYPENITPEKDFVSYNSIEDLKTKIKYYLKNEEERENIALSGLKTIEKYYSKEKQWQNFQAIVEQL